MQPSSKYASTEQTYAGGFVYKETNSNFSALFGLDDELDMSVSYTTPINSDFDNVNMGGWNNSSASAYITKDLQFSKNWVIPAGTRQYCNVNGLKVSKDSFSSSGNVTVVFAKGNQTYYYFGKSAQASSTVGSFGQKLVTDFDVSHIAFKANITGWTKADFEYFINNGTLQDSDGYTIDFDDFMANPSDYYIRTFDTYANAYWNGSEWRANNLSNSPNIHIYFLVDTDKISGICNLNKHHFNAASATGAFGVEYKVVSNSSSTNATEISALNRGSVSSQLDSAAGFILGSAVSPLVLDIDISLDDMQTLCDSGVKGEQNTLPAHEVEFCPAVRVLKYDKFQMYNDVGTTGTTHPSDYRMYFCMGLKGDYLSKVLAYAGVYFYTGSLSDLNSSGATPTNMKVSGMFLGEMNSAGQTTGNWIAPEQMDDYVGPNKSGSIVHPDYDPSGGGGGGDDDDPSDNQAWGGAYSGAGAFSKFYLCTATDLANLRTWFGGGGSGDQIPDGFDPMGQVLGLLQYPVSISGTALAPEEIVFRSGKTIIHTGVNADRSTGGFLHLNCGSVEIPRRMQQRGVPFLDFETTLEIYVPFCGTAPLDVQTCVGKTLTCDMYVATATGDVSAVIAAGGHPVAYMSGNMAESLPISSSGYGMYLAACKSTWGNGVSQVMNQLTGGTTDTLKNVNQAALNETLSYNQTGGWGRSELIAESYNNPRIGSAMAAAAGPAGAAAIGLIKTGLNVMNAATTGYEQYKRVKNASYTSVSGSFTSCAAWNYPFTPYVKITRPHKQIPTGGRGDYKHTAAIPLVETKTLSGAPGLTTCVNPDVSGIANATAQEKDIIYRALVNGVIV